MSRPGKEVKIGHDKRPAPLITTDQPLYNVRSGKPLTDEGGTPLSPPSVLGGLSKFAPLSTADLALYHPCQDLSLERLLPPG